MRKYVRTTIQATLICMSSRQMADVNDVVYVWEPKPL